MYYIIKLHFSCGREFKIKQILINNSSLKLLHWMIRQEMFDIQSMRKHKIWPCFMWQSPFNYDLLPGTNSLPYFQLIRSTIWSLEKKMLTGFRFCLLWFFYTLYPCIIYSRLLGLKTICFNVRMTVYGRNEIFYKHLYVHVYMYMKIYIWLIWKCWIKS